MDSNELEMDKKVLQFQAELSKAKYKLWVQDQKQVRVAALVNKSEQYYKQLKKREKDIVPRSALYKKYLNDNINKRDANDNEDSLPSRSELIAQLRKANCVRNYEDFIGIDDNDRADKHESSFYHYYSNQNSNTNNENNNNNNTHKNNDNEINTAEEEKKKGAYALGINNIFALKITKIFLKYINYCQNNTDRSIHNDNDTVNDTNDNYNNNNNDIDTIDTIDSISISDSANLVVENNDLIREDTSSQHENISYDDSANIEVISNDIDSTSNEIENCNKENNDNNQDNVNDQNNDTSIEIDEVKDTAFQPEEKKKNKPTKSVTLKLLNQKVAESTAVKLDYSGAEYRRRRYWSSRSQKLESSIRLIEKNDSVMQDVQRMYDISKASNIAMIDTFIKLDNSTHDKIQHLTCSWKYLTNEYIVSINNCFEDDINPFVQEFVNDFRPLIQSDNDAHLSHYIRSSSQHPERFPVKAVLKAVTKKGKIHYRPLCTAGDVVLAIMELMDANIFDHGYVQLPHVISGPFVRQTEGFYRYQYKLNSPGEWRYLKKKLSSKNALYEFLCPNFCLDAFFESEVVNIEEVNIKLKDECFAAIKALQSNFKEDEILMEAVLDFEACTEMKYNMDHHNVFYPPEHVSFEPVDNVILPKFQKRSNVDDSDDKKRATKRIYVKGNITYYRLLHVVKFQKVARIAHYRRNAVSNFHGINKLQEFNVLLKEEKRKIIETDRAHIKKLRDALDKYKKLTFEDFQTVDEKLDEILDRNNIFNFPRSWKNGKRTIENTEEEIVIKKQPYSHERMRAHELALKWFEDDFDDSDDDGVRIVDSDTDNDNEIKNIKNVTDDLTLSRIDAERIKTNISVNQVIVSETRNMMREIHDMGKEDYDILTAQSAITNKPKDELNKEAMHRKKENKRRDSQKSIKTVDIGVTIKGLENNKQIYSRGKTNETGPPQKQFREENVNSSSTPLSYVPLTYTTPTINSLIKPDFDMSKEKITSKAHAKYIDGKNKSTEKSDAPPTSMKIQSFIELWSEICDNELRLLQELETEDVSKRDFRYPTAQDMILSRTAFDAASKLSPELIFDGKTISTKVDEIKKNTMKSQAIDTAAANQRMERFHRDRREQAINSYKQDCEDALRGLLKGMKPWDITAILKAIRLKSKGKKKRRKNKKIVVIIPKKEEGGYPQGNEETKEELEEGKDLEDGDSDDSDDDNDDDDDDDEGNDEQAIEQPEEIDISYLLGGLDTEPMQVAHTISKKPKAPKPKLVFSARRSSLLDNTLSWGNKIKSRVERMTKAMKKMLAKAIFNLKISTIDGDLVEEEARATQKAQEEADRLRKLNAYRLHLLPKSSSSQGTAQVEPVGGKLWGDDLTEQLLARRSINISDDNDSAFHSASTTLVPGAQLFEHSESIFTDSVNDNSEENPFMSNSQLSLIGEIINEPKIVITRTNDPLRIRISAIHNIVDGWIEIARKNVALICKDYLIESGVIKPLSLDTDSYEDDSSSKSCPGISSIVINSSTVSKLTSASFPSASISDIDENTMNGSFWKSYDELKNKKSNRPPIEMRLQIEMPHSVDRKHSRKDKKSNVLVPVHNPDVSNLILIAKSVSNNSNENSVDNYNVIPPFTPVETAVNDKVLFPRTIIELISDDKNDDPNANISNTIKKNNVIGDINSDWIPSQSVCLTESIQDSLQNNSIFDIPKHILIEGIEPRDNNLPKLPRTVEELLTRPTISNDGSKSKVIDKVTVTSSKKKSTIFSSIHSLAKSTTTNRNVANTSDLDCGVMGLSIPVPHDKNNYSAYYDANEYYDDDEYKQYLEEEDSFSGYEIGLVISHYDTNVRNYSNQKFPDQELDDGVRKLQKLMAECFHDNLPFVIGKKFQPTLDDIYERSESEVEFGLGLDSSILDVISNSLYKDNDKDFNNESLTIDDSISALTGANFSIATHSTRFEDNEFSSLLLIDKIPLSHASSTSHPKRPSDNKRSHNFHRKSIRDLSNMENEVVDEPIISRISVDITPMVSITTGDNSNEKDTNANVASSIYLNKYLKRGILQEAQREIRDIAPTISGKYLESKRKLISREFKEDDTSTHKILDDDNGNMNQRSPSRGNKSPASSGRLRTPERDSSLLLNYSPPSSPSATVPNPFSDIIAVGICKTIPNNFKRKLEREN